MCLYQKNRTEQDFTCVQSHLHILKDFATTWNVLYPPLFAIGPFCLDAKIVGTFDFTWQNNDLIHTCKSSLMLINDSTHFLIHTRGLWSGYNYDFFLEHVLVHLGLKLDRDPLKINNFFCLPRCILFHLFLTHSAKEQSDFQRNSPTFRL